LPNAGVTTFDPLQHHRERTRKAEARADSLEEINDRLYRLLALTLQVATAGRDVDPCTLLAVIEDMDRIAA
jgi:hypothetical protein